jgi:hypothetical protein
VQGKSISPTLGLFCPCGSAPGRASDEKWLPADSTHQRSKSTGKNLSSSSMRTHGVYDTMHTVAYVSSTTVHVSTHRTQTDTAASTSRYSPSSYSQMYQVCLILCAVADCGKCKFAWIAFAINLLFWIPSGQQTDATGWSNPF